jgi:hypothetical protein
MSPAMRPDRKTSILIVVALTALLSGCSQAVLDATSPPGFTVEDIEGSELKRVTLSEETADRIGVETAEVARDAAGHTTVPAAAVFYAADGGAWLYTSPSEHVYVRQPIKVAVITSGVAQLTDGPAPSTKVVTVGVQQLFGTETGVGDPE